MKVKISLGADTGFCIDGFEMENLKEVKKLIIFIFELMNKYQDLIIKDVVFHHMNDTNEYVG